jgi:catechol 2,3-dioxygenase-like lactoylglutathione lyase family enzyme
MTVLTIGVRDLERASTFYSSLFGIRPNPDYEGVAFFELQGVWLSLYPLDKLAEDISPDLSPAVSGFRGMTLAYNARSKDEVRAIFAEVEACGGKIVKPPQDTFWGGFAGYFVDPDGCHWEIAWGPMFDFGPHGDLLFKKQRNKK